MRSVKEYILWDGLKDKLIKLHPTLTKSDLLWRNGNVSSMLEIISSKLGITSKELKDNIDKL